MKTIFYLLLITLTIVGCKSKQMSVEPTVPLQPALQPVEEVVGAEEQITVRQEDVQLTHGTEMMTYCIILGSFEVEKNAVDLRQSLIDMGFTHSSIMRNNLGMYRVSAACYDSESQARVELLKIRHQYEQFHDAWLLITH